MKIKTADPKANASVFLFFPTTDFIKAILSHRTLLTFAFACSYTSPPEGKVKREQSPTLNS